MTEIKRKPTENSIVSYPRFSGCDGRTVAWSHDSKIANPENTNKRKRQNCEHPNTSTTPAALRRPIASKWSCSTAACRESKGNCANALSRFGVCANALSVYRPPSFIGCTVASDSCDSCCNSTASDAKPNNFFCAAHRW